MQQQQAKQRSRIPKFGSWDSSDSSSTPFTELFDDARAGKSGEEVFAGRMRNAHPHKINPTVTKVGHLHARKPSREDGHQPRQIEPPAHQHIVDDSRYVPQMSHSHSANESGSAARFAHSLANLNMNNMNSSGNNSSNMKSPHRSGQRSGSNSTSSPSWERKAEGSSTPGRSRLRNSNTNNVEAEKAPVLPKFGAWDSNDPSSGDGFTVIFNNARNVKKAGGAVHIPPLAMTEKDLYPERGSATDAKAPSKKIFCCFQPSEVKA